MGAASEPPDGAPPKTSNDPWWFAGWFGPTGVGLIVGAILYDGHWETRGISAALGVSALVVAWVLNPTPGR